LCIVSQISNKNINRGYRSESKNQIKKLQYLASVI